MKHLRKCMVAVVVAAAAVASVAFWGACGGGGGPTAPTVTSTNATGKLYTTSPISITFSTTMDQASVASAFSITGSDPVAGTIAWADSTMTFTPDALWKTNHPYTITITTAATDANGTPFKEAYTQQFTPRINLHDVNGDGIDDFMLSAPSHDFDAVTTDAGAAYLFLGKNTWADIDLATQPADAKFDINSANTHFALDAKVVGDIDGDGFADMVMTTPDVGVGGFSNNGFVIIHYGSASPAGFTIDPANPDVADALLMGPADDAYLGWPVMPAGDVNGDGLADFVLGGRFPPADSRYWLVLGSTTRLPKPSLFTSVAGVAAADYITPGLPTVTLVFHGFPIAACDINGDELADLVLGVPRAAGGGTNRGQAFVIAGSAAPASLDLRSVAADATFSGAADNGLLGADVACGDVNGDGYGDILMGAPGMDGGKGRAYLMAGAATLADRNFAVDSPTATYTGEATTDELSGVTCIPGDVNKDGYADMLIGAPEKPIDGKPAIGRAYLFLGAASPSSVDLSAGGAADATFTGFEEVAGKPYLLGFCKAVGDINADGIDDILLGAPAAPGGGNFRGQVFTVFGTATGPASVDLATDKPDVTITGAADGDALILMPVPL